MNDNKRICSNCGQALEPDDAFCGECGHRVSLHSDTTQPEYAEKPQKAGVPHPVPPPRPGSPLQTSSEKPRREFKKLWLTVTILTGLLIAVAGAFFIYEPSDTTITQPTSKQDNRAISQIKIANVDSFYEQNTLAGKIFVVIGNVVNQNTSPVRFIRVEATLYGPDDAFLTRQSAYAGNAIDRQQLKSQPIHSIKLMMHRPYGHNPGEQLAEGGTLPFMIVFANLPDLEQSRYEVRVITAHLD